MLNTPRRSVAASAITAVVGTTLAAPGTTGIPGQIMIEREGLRAVLLADLDGDGRDDLITTETGVLTVRPGFMSEEPGVPFDLAVGEGPIEVLVHDFNADALNDLAVADTAESAVRVYLADGHGGFVRTDDRLFVRRTPRFMGAADLDADGIDDLVVANGGSTTEVFVFRGTGGGRFELNHAFTTPRHLHRGLLLQDLDADGRTDLALALLGPYEEPHSRVYVYPGRGDGSFAPPAYFLVPRSVTAMTAADLDADGRTDLVTSSWAGGSAGLLMNRGGLVFEPSTIETEDCTTAVAAHDFDDDGLPDLAFTLRAGTGPEPQAVALFRNDRGGRFERVASPLVGRDPDRIVMGRFGHAGPAGLVVRMDDPRRLTVVEFDDFARPRGRMFTGVDDRIERVFPARLNRDGLTDMIYLRENGTIGLLVSDDAGVLAAAPDPVVDGWYYDMTVADLNADGLDDVVFANTGFHATSALIGTGNGRFAPLKGEFADASSVRAADLDEDGVPDLVQTRTNRPWVGVRLGRGDGTAGDVVWSDLPRVPERIETGDLNGDGATDVVAIMPGDGAGVKLFQAMLGDGRGGLTPGWSAEIGGYVADVLVADLNADSRDDLILTYPIAGARVYFSTPGGPPAEGPAIGEGHKLGDVCAADVTGDGIVDLFASMPERDAVRLYEGLGAGSFGPSQEFLAGMEPGGLAAADFNADGVADIAAVNPGDRHTAFHAGVSVLAPARCAADLASPFGVLDVGDAAAFVQGFRTGDPRTDLAAPYGVWDFRDVRRFVNVLSAGCP
jgi:hypothetical protein